jgi:DNA ligase-1
MKQFAQLLDELDQTMSTNAKVDSLLRFFTAVDEEDIIWAIALLTGRKLKRVMRTAALRTWAAAAAGIPLWLFEESYHITGDLAEAITLMLPAPVAETNYSLAETVRYLASLDQMSEEEKERAIRKRWSEMPKSERFVFNKMITGNFRLGVSRQLVVKALAKYFDLGESFVAHRLMGNWDPANTRIQTLLEATGDLQPDYQPYPFFLAYALEDSPQHLGPLDEWLIERKLDGIRGQIIVRNGQLFVWSRGEELMTDKFPEFEPLAAQLPTGTVLDGEIIPWKNGAPLPFAVMQTRIGRKTLSPKIREAAPLVMVCFDLLEWQGEDIRQQPLSWRREQLRKLLSTLAVPVPLILSDALECSDWESVRQWRANARNSNYEGVMIKRLQSSYQSGRRRGDWWKWKVEPFTVDGVLLYAQQGHGRRANLLTDYTFAVWDGDALVPFAKAYSGLTDKEMLEVDAWVKRHTVEKFGPVRSVQPLLVFELAFEGINKSTRHKSGVALRFPRILRWRRDKGPKDANTKEDLLQLIGSQSI